MQNEKEKEILINKENKQIKEDKILLGNNKDNSINNNIYKYNENNEENKIKEDIQMKEKLNKSQILQDKLKKIFIEREANKYKYNVVNIPENLKYSSDNSNSSSPRIQEQKLLTKNKLEVSKQNIIKEDNNKIQNIYKANLKKEILERFNNQDNIEKSKNNEKAYKEDNINIDTNYMNINNHDSNIMNNVDSYIKNYKNYNKDLKTYQNNIIDSNIINNNSIDNSINNIDNDNIIEKKIYKNDINNDDKISVEHNQSCKNYIIKRIPEIKKNKKKK